MEYILEVHKLQTNLFFKHGIWRVFNESDHESLVGHNVDRIGDLGNLRDPCQIETINFIPST